LSTAKADTFPSFQNDTLASTSAVSIYEKTANDIKVVEPKAHGLGYLAAPKEEKDGEEGNWISEAWDWLLRRELGLECTTPTWLDVPAMMPIVISTPNVLQRLEPRPFSFLLIPQIDSQGGLPANVDGTQFTLVTSYTSNRSDWPNSECVNIFDGEIYRLALEQTAKLDKVIPRTYGHVLYLYTKHPEAKSLAPNGTACTCETRGLLTAAAREEQIDPRTVRKYLKTEMRGRGKPTKADRRKRNMLVPTSLGNAPVTLRGSKQASELGKYMSAVGKYLRTGNVEALARFEGKSIGGHPLITDPDLLSSLAQAGALTLDEIYALPEALA